MVTNMQFLAFPFYSRGCIRFFSPPRPKIASTFGLLSGEKRSDVYRAFSMGLKKEGAGAEANLHGLHRKM